MGPQSVTSTSARLLVYYFVIALFVGPTQVRAEVKQPSIPQTPSAPPTLVHKAPPDVFQCQRRYIYKGKVLNCDSNVRADAEGLRPIFQNTPEAISELNIYQANRRKVQVTAYTTTAGIVVGLAALFLGQQMKDENGTITSTGKSIRGIGAAVGFSTAGISIIYGLSLLRTNERHLGQAVKHYNQSHPDNPIELQFSTGIDLW